MQDKRQRILIVEDDYKIGRVLELELYYEGYYVERAETGRIGLNKALLDKWDLMLLDIMLPELNGLEVLSLLRDRKCDIPVILLSACDEPLNVARGLDLGATDYIKKPYNIEELLTRIRVCISGEERKIVRDNSVYSRSNHQPSD